MLSILIFLFPPLYGEGYDTIGSLLNGQFSHIMDKSLFYDLNDTYFGVLIFLTLILLTKVFASSATNAGGGAVVFSLLVCIWAVSPVLSLRIRLIISRSRCISRRRISLCWVWRVSCLG